MNEHMVRTRLVCLEQTHNSGGGRIQPYENVVRICDWAAEQGLRRHLDGARLFNAVVASGISASEWSRHFDTVSVCFSKGLGAPVGSALAGPKDLIQSARRHRKLFGGGMRQAGVIAAGALYGLENHVDRMAEDHSNARLLAETIRETELLQLKHDQVDTNIVIFKVDPSLASAAEFVAALKEHGVWALANAPQMVRMITHLDVTTEQVEQAAKIVQRVADGLAR